jgi:hypothetical protein
MKKYFALEKTKVGYFLNLDFGFINVKLCKKDSFLRLFDKIERFEFPQEVIEYEMINNPNSLFYYFEVMEPNKTWDSIQEFITISEII